MLAAVLFAVLRNAAVQVMAGDGATPAEAAQVETRLWTAFGPLLEKRGFRLVPLQGEYLSKQGIPAEEQHAAGNSPASTALIVRMRELDVELVFMTVLTRDGGESRLALAAMGFHDLSSLGADLRRAPSLPALQDLLEHDAPALIDAALAKFKPAPKPAWWNPQVAPATPPPPPVASANRLRDGAMVAVLDFKHAASFTTDDARYLADVVRAGVLKTAPRLGVMTRENLIVLLQASGKDLAECEGECEVDTGRRIGADAVISGDVLKFGERFKLSLRLHETKGGRLLAAAVASGATLEELDAQVQQRAGELLEGQR